MRIGIDLRMAGADYGIGRYSLELVGHILELDRENEYFLFVRDPAKFARSSFSVYKNVRLVRANYRHYRFSEQVFYLSLLNSYNLDLVHFLNFNVPIFYRRPFVVTIHDVVHHKLPGNKPSRALFRLGYRFVIKNAAEKSRKIITVSNFSKEEIMQTLKVPGQKIKVIYEAASLVPVSDSDIIQARQKFNITKPYIIFVGVMERKKNVPMLARAFNVLKEKYQLNIQLVLVGKEDPYYPEVMQEVRSIKYAKDLVVTGTVSDKEKYALLKGAQAFVSASLFEGFGLPGVEAMSLGVPLIVSNTPVFNEVYDNAAIYFEPNDPEDIAQKIHLLLTDQKYRAMVCGNAYSRSLTFSWEKTAAETLNVYTNYEA